MRQAELSINVIVAAAIALLVLVILSFVFIDEITEFLVKQEDCSAINGQCIYGNSCGEVNMIPHPEAKCYTNEKVDEFRVCCIAKAD